MIRWKLSVLYEEDLALSTGIPLWQHLNTDTLRLTEDTWDMSQRWLGKQLHQFSEPTPLHTRQQTHS